VPPGDGTGANLLGAVAHDAAAWSHSGLGGGAVAIGVAAEDASEVREVTTTTVTTTTALSRSLRSRRAGAVLVTTDAVAVPHFGDDDDDDDDGGHWQLPQQWGVDEDDDGSGQQQQQQQLLRQWGVDGVLDALALESARLGALGNGVGAIVDSLTHKDEPTAGVAIEDVAGVGVNGDASAVDVGVLQPLIVTSGVSYLPCAATSTAATDITRATFGTRGRSTVPFRTSSLAGPSTFVRVAAGVAAAARAALGHGSAKSRRSVDAREHDARAFPWQGTTSPERRRGRRRRLRPLLPGYGEAVD